VKRFFLITGIFFCLTPSVSFASDSDSSSAYPSVLSDILAMHHDKVKKKKGTKKILHIRDDAVKDEAFTLGSQAGLWWKGTHLQAQLKSVSNSLDDVWRFQSLMVSNGKVVPPVITMVRNHVETRDDILQIVDKQFRILSNAHFAAAAPNWRNYMLYDDFKKPDFSGVPNALKPKKDEIEIWKEYVLKGWKVGQQQAVEVMADNMHRLSRDFIGMVRYHMLLKLRMVSEPFVDKRFTVADGDPDKLNIGKDVRVLKIKPAMNIHPESWVALPELPSALTPKKKGW